MYKFSKPDALAFLNQGTEGSLYNILNRPPPPPAISVDTWHENTRSFLHAQVRNYNFRLDIKQRTEPSTTTNTTEASTPSTTEAPTPGTTKSPIPSTTAGTTPTTTPAAITVENRSRSHETPSASVPPNVVNTLSPLNADTATSLLSVASSSPATPNSSASSTAINIATVNETVQREGKMSSLPTENEKRVDNIHSLNVGEAKASISAKPIAFIDPEVQVAVMAPMADDSGIINEFQEEGGSGAVIIGSANMRKVEDSTPITGKVVEVASTGPIMISLSGNEASTSQNVTLPAEVSAPSTVSAEPSTKSHLPGQSTSENTTQSNANIVSTPSSLVSTSTTAPVATEEITIRVPVSVSSTKPGVSLGNFALENHDHTTRNTTLHTVTEASGISNEIASDVTSVTLNDTVQRTTNRRIKRETCDCTSTNVMV